jgi:hypothetical protein
MATNPTYEGAVIADAISYRGQVQPIGGTANAANPPYVINVPNGNSPSVDAFGRQRVSLSNSLFDGKFRFDLLPALYDQTVTGTGSITYQTNEKCSRLAVTNGGIGRALMRSHQSFLYRAAQSMQIDISLCSGAITANTVKRYGYFDDNNGIIYQVGSTDLRFILRTATSGAPSDANFVSQTNWNLDTLLGTGGTSNPSGFTLDVTKTQILVIDYQFLGVGRVRMGFNIGGNTIWCHQFLNANTTLAVQYMQTGCLPISAELRSFVAQNASLDFICAGVIKEGSSGSEQSYQATANTRSVAAAGQSLQNAVSETVLVVGLRSGYEAAYLTLDSVTAFNTSNQGVYFEVALFRGYAGGGFGFSNCGTASQFSTTVISAPTAPAVAGSGYLLTSGFVGGSSGQSIQISSSTANGVLVATGTDLFVVRAYGLAGVATSHFVLNFQEYY